MGYRGCGDAGGVAARDHRWEVAALADRRARRTCRICLVRSLSRWISRIRSRARSSIIKLMSCLQGIAASVAPRGERLLSLSFR